MARVPWLSNEKLPIFGSNGSLLLLATSKFETTRSFFIHPGGCETWNHSRIFSRQLDLHNVQISQYYSSFVTISSLNRRVSTDFDSTRSMHFFFAEMSSGPISRNPSIKLKIFWKVLAPVLVTQPISYLEACFPFIEIHFGFISPRITNREHLRFCVPDQAQHPSRMVSKLQWSRIGGFRPVKGKFFGLYGDTSYIRVFYSDDHRENLGESTVFGQK